MRYLKTKKTTIRYDEAPTAKSWMIAALAEVEEQRERLLAGIACETCHGSGNLALRCIGGVTWTACFACDGTGSRK